MSTQSPLNLVIAGVGGQGSLFASQVIAQAAIRDGFSVRISETYGVTQRGGPVYSQVRIGHHVYGPLISLGRSELILGLEPIETLRRAADYLAPGGSVAINTRINVPLETTLGKQPYLSLETIREKLIEIGCGELLIIDARALAEKAGGADSMNVLMIGTLFGFDKFTLSYEGVKEAVKAVSRPNFLEGNLLSLAKGREYALSFKTKSHER